MTIRVKDCYAKKRRAIKVTDIFQGSETFMVMGHPVVQKTGTIIRRDASVMIWETTEVSEV